MSSQRGTHFARAGMLNREVQIVTEHGVSRRSLFRAAGVGAAVAGGGALLEACSSGIQGASSSATTSASAGTSTRAPQSSTAAAASGEITIGWIHPETGGLAGFGYPDKWVVDDHADPAVPERVEGRREHLQGHHQAVRHPVERDPGRGAGQAGHPAGQRRPAVRLLHPRDRQRGRVPGRGPRHPADLLQHPVGVLVHQPGRQPPEAYPQAQEHHHVLPRRRAPRARIRPMWDQIGAKHGNNHKVAAAFPNDSDGNAFRAVPRRSSTRPATSSTSRRPTPTG